MNRKKELCRNFQRGSCQYGDRCKFLHMTQQPQKPSPFGFGIQNASPFITTNQQHQQQKPNPFGFGVQNASQSRGAPNIASHYQSQPQPFINKWTRPSSTTATSAKPSKQVDTQPQAVAHECTDPELCKRQIIKDFNQERPVWKLTCYGHNRGLPCDVLGDVSYEELRAAAYEDARQGLNLQTIVERERNLLNSKLMEYDNFLRNPYVKSQTTNSAGQNFPPAINHEPFHVHAQSNITPSFSSFSQPGASADIGPTMRSPSPVNNTFGQENSFQGHSQTSSAFEMKFRTSASPFGTSSAQSTPTVNTGSHIDGHKVAANMVSQPVADGHLMVNREESNTENVAIWLKQEWEIGEIPEEEPPARFCV